MKGCVIEHLANAARIDGTHGIIRVTLLVTLDGMLHGQTAIKHDLNEEFGRISATAARAENPPSEWPAKAAPGARLDQTFRMHVFEAASDVTTRAMICTN